MMPSTSGADPTTVAGSLRRFALEATPLRWCALAIGLVTAAWVALTVRPTVASVVFGLALISMIGAAAIDVVEQRLPNLLTIGIAAFGLAALPVITWTTGSGGAWRAIADGAIFGGWILAGTLALRGAYGLGDVKLAAACGIFAAWLSWPALVVAILASQVAITATLIYGRLQSRERMLLGRPSLSGW